MIGGIEFNARSLSPAEIARWFVPPEQHFLPLISRNHTIVIGPRGSGKTTLLKMLTIGALANWEGENAGRFLGQVKFNSALIPADRLWGEQLRVLESERSVANLGEKIFVAHTLCSLLRAMRDVIGYSQVNKTPQIEHLSATLTAEQERQFVELVAPSFNIKLRLNSVLGLILAIEETLTDAGDKLETSNFKLENFISLLSYTISAFNEISGNHDRQWALLFDELEIAPERIRSLLISSMRSIDQRIIFKLAFAPYMPDYGTTDAPTAPQVLHDYDVVSLTYPNKEDSKTFATQLAERIFGDELTTEKSLRNVFGDSQFRVRWKKGAQLPTEFYDLANKDDSFKAYLEEHNFDDRKFDEENERAQFIRKISPIVKSRDYYLSKFRNQRPARRRSRKSYSLYCGYPSIIEVADGNPRALLTMFSPLAEAYRVIKETGSKRPLSIDLQAEAVKRAEFLQVSLLNVIPIVIPGFKKQRGLAEFMDVIGRAFEHKLLYEPFKADYIGTFTVDQNISDKAMAAIGQAVNVGALVFVPHSDASPDGILKGIRGMRFRLSFSLAARYRIPLSLGLPINLSSLLNRDEDFNSMLKQASLLLDIPHED